MNISDRSLRVLLVEDNPGDARLLQLALEEAAGTFDVDHIDRLEAALALLRGGSYDVALLDLSLPDNHGLDKMGNEFGQV